MRSGIRTLSGLSRKDGNNNNYYYWRFWSGWLRGKSPTIAPFIYNDVSSQPHKFVPCSHRSPGGREGHVTEWRRELNPLPADRARRDQRIRPLGHLAPQCYDFVLSPELVRYEKGVIRSHLMPVLHFGIGKTAGEYKSEVQQPGVAELSHNLQCSQRQIGRKKGVIKPDSAI